LSVATTAIGIAAQGGEKFSSPLEKELSNAQPEFRLISLRGQDRSVNVNSYARTTDKGFQNGRIYSLDFGYKMKPKINKNFIVEKCRFNVRLET
jgi:hypothetical protein